MAEQSSEIHFMQAKWFNLLGKNRPDRDNFTPDRNKVTCKKCKQGQFCPVTIQKWDGK